MKQISDEDNQVKMTARNLISLKVSVCLKLEKKTSWYILAFLGHLSSMKTQLFKD
jgi:hypothetical protein